jgi:uncharacterized membrane protein YtjA (UPF0391 family)
LSDIQLGDLLSSEQWRLELGIWQGLGLWISLEYTSTLEVLPIQRLGYGGLTNAGVAVIVVVVVLIILVVGIQAWTMRKVGLIQYYLVRYVPDLPLFSVNSLINLRYLCLVPILLVLAFIPGYTLRLHHYLLALLAIPILSLPNRISLALQAFALGLFIDGVGRWGWASILQQTAGLIGDADIGTGRPIFDLGNSTADVLSWYAGEGSGVVGLDGVGVVVDDILRIVNVTSNSESHDPLHLILSWNELMWHV